MSKSTREFISCLLVKNPQQRLGGGANGFDDVKAHPFFSQASPNFTWDKVYERKMSPPIIPRVDNELDTRHFSEEYQGFPSVESPEIINPNLLFRVNILLDIFTILSYFKWMVLKMFIFFFLGLFLRITTSSVIDNRRS